MLLKDKAPGKIYVIGEYNVLKSGHSALIAPVNLYIEATLKQSDQFVVKAQNGVEINLEKDSVPHNLNYTVTTITMFHEYLATVNKKPEPFTLTITNNLKAKDKLKYGLGSSGASIVLVLKLLNQYYKTNFDNLVMLKFAILVQKQLNHYSSGGDLAVSVFDAYVLYTRYDTKWLQNVPFSFSLLTEDWPLLNVKVVNNVPPFAIGWTKETFKPNVNDTISEFFFVAAEKLVQSFAISFDREAIDDYQKLLNEIACKRPGMMTQKLQTLITVAQQMGLSAKISGAGYGDSGIALLKTRKDKKRLQKVWAENDIMLLDIWRK